MGIYKTPPKVERENTDGSLRHKRRKTDEVLAAKRREKADGKLDLSGRTGEERKAAALERLKEDGALQKARAFTDDSLQWEPKEHYRALAALLPLKRERTHRYLLTER